MTRKTKGNSKMNSLKKGKTKHSKGREQGATLYRTLKKDDGKINKEQMI